MNNMSINKHSNSNSMQNKIVYGKNTNYWFQDVSSTLLNLDELVEIMPNNDMSYPEKINALVRLSIYIGVILALLCYKFIYLYIPIITMLATYFIYLFRMKQLEQKRASIGANTKLNDMSKSSLQELTNKNMISNNNGNNGNNSNNGENFLDILNIKHCNKPIINNPFMNRLIFDSKTNDIACDAVNPETQLQIEKEYNKYTIKDASDIWNHNSGRRQFYTMPNTNFINNQGAFANWLYKMPATCKEGNGSRCIANIPFRINTDLSVPSFSQ